MIVVTGSGGEDDEEKGREGEEEAVEAEPGPRGGGFGGGEVLIEADVLNGGEGKGEALRELDATDDGEGEEAVEEGHEAGGPEEEEDASGGQTSGGDLGEGEVRGLGYCDGSDGLHGLDGHGDAEEEAGGEVIEGGEDEGGAEVEVGDEGEGQDDGDVGAEVTHCAGELGAERGFEAEVVAPPLVEEEWACGGGGE